METTTEIITEYATEVGTAYSLQDIQASLTVTNTLLSSINTYLQGALILIVCVFVYKFFTMLTGT